MPGLILMAVFFGDLHIHTEISSDAVGDPVELFEVARNEENLDFIAITDHDTTMDAAEWDLTRATAMAANVPGVFVAFSGIEWTVNVHFNVYFLGDDEPFCTNCNTLTKFYDFYGDVLRSRNAGAQINHPNNTITPSFLDHTLVRNTELWNGRHEATDQEYGPRGAVYLLGEGNRLGFVGTSDDHSFDGTGEHARRLGDTLTGCHAASLTRASILDALYNRRCFATDNLRTVVDLAVNGVPMGGYAALCAGEPYDVDFFVSGTATPSLVEIVEDGEVIASRNDCVSPDCNLSTTGVVAVNPFTDIYGRVTHDPSTGCVNCKTWASPVRVFGVIIGPCTPPGTPGTPAIGDLGFAVLIAIMAGAAFFALREIRPA